MTRRSFAPATELSGAFYREAVRPLLGDRPHAAALLGWGSDVLGYDTERSTDHGWGPRLLVFLPDGDQGAELTARLDEQLPASFRGWPVRYGWDGVPAQHWVTVTTLPRWCEEHLGVDATAGLSTRDWLTVGTAFARLVHDDGLPAQLHAAVHAPDAQRRQDALAAAYRSIARRSNAAGITPLLDPEVGSYHSRPAQVLMADRFAAGWLEAVSDRWLRSLPMVGAVDQLVDSTGVLEHPALWRRVAAVYGTGL